MAAAARPAEAAVTDVVGCGCIFPGGAQGVHGPHSRKAFLPNDISISRLARPQLSPLLRGVLWFVMCACRCCHRCSILCAPVRAASDGAAWSTRTHGSSQ